MADGYAGGGRAILTLNLEAPFRLSQIFVPSMLPRKWGRLINVSSIYGLIAGDPALYGECGVWIRRRTSQQACLIGVSKHFRAVTLGFGVTVTPGPQGMLPNTERNPANASGLGGLEARTGPVKRVERRR